MKDAYFNLMEPWHEQLENELLKSHMPLVHAEVTRSYSANQNIVATALDAHCHELRVDLLAHIYAQSAVFFEHLIIDLVLALGYGGKRRDFARRTGRSGDGGIDGVIELDALGLDVVFLQGKRLKPGSVVSSHAVRDFIGSLEARHASKGVFITTADFSSDARNLPETISKRLALISGSRLVDLMLRYRVGVRIAENFAFPEIDRAYFERAFAKTAATECVRKP